MLGLSLYPIHVRVRRLGSASAALARVASGIVFAAVLLAASRPVIGAQLPPYKAGDRVDVDVIFAGAPERAMWRPGAVQSIDLEKREIIVVTDPATDAGGRTVGISFQSASKWLRPSSAPRPAQPAANKASATAAAPVPPPSAAPESLGILPCPIAQPKVTQGSRPNPEVLSKVIRCLFEQQGKSRAERSVKVDIQSLETGSPRNCVPREDFECGLPVHKIYPALVRWTKTDYYTYSIQSSENESVFNCFVNAFGQWQCGLGRRIKDGALQTRQRL